jgi:serine/threonine protein kinase
VLLNKEIENALMGLHRYGGRIGAWDIAPADEGWKAGGQGLILRGKKRDMLGEIQHGAIKIQLPAQLPDGTQVFQGKVARLMLEKFAHENSILEYLNANSQSPNILRALDKGSDQLVLADGTCVHISYFVTELLNGEDLLDLVTGHRGITNPIHLHGEHWLNLAYDLLSAAMDISALGVVHQDLKPQNVMLHNNRYVVVDFGMASYINVEDLGDMPGGTLGFMSPEQFYRLHWDHDGFANNDATVDMYAIGMTLAFASSGIRPWGHIVESLSGMPKDEAMHTFYQRMCEEEPLVTGLGQEQLKLVREMTQVDMNRRPQARAALKRIVEMMPESNIRRKEYLATQKRPLQVARRDSQVRPKVTKRQGVQSQGSHRSRIDEGTLVGATKNFVAELRDLLAQGKLNELIFVLLGASTLLNLVVLSRGVAIIPIGAIMMIPEDEYKSRPLKERATIWWSMIMTCIPSMVAVYFLATSRDRKVRALAGWSIPWSIPYAMAFFNADKFLVPDGSTAEPTWWSLLPIAAVGYVVVSCRMLIARVRAQETTEGLNFSLKSIKWWRTRSARSIQHKPATRSVVGVPSVGKHEPPADSAEIGKDPSSPAFGVDENGRPLFPINWTDITLSIYDILGSMKRKRFVFDVKSPQVQGLFIQGYCEPDSSITAECAADLSVRPRITQAQYDNLLALGWEAPSKQIPNFIKFFTAEESSHDQVAEFLTATIRDGYGIPPDSVSIE